MTAVIKIIIYTFGINHIIIYFIVLKTPSYENGEYVYTVYMYIY